MPEKIKTFDKSEWREELKYEYLQKKAAWKGHEAEPVTPANSRELEGDSLIYSAFREGIGLLDHMEKAYGVAPSMRDYAKIMTWTAEKLKDNFYKEIEKDKREGWEVTAHHWPGEHGDLASNVGLRPSQWDESFWRRVEEGKIDQDGMSLTN